MVGVHALDLSGAYFEGHPRPDAIHVANAFDDEVAEIRPEAVGQEPPVEFLELFAVAGLVLDFQLDV